MGNAVLKLMNGDEIIATIDHIDEQIVTVTNPVQIHRVMTQYGTEMIKCSYWLLFNKNPTVTIDRYNVLTYAEDISDKVNRHYEFFLKNAIQDLEHDVEDISKHVEKIEREYKKKMLKLDRQEEEFNELEEEMLDAFGSSNTTIH